MTTTVTEGELKFEFDATWRVVKWDDCEFRRLREHHGKAVDILGFRKVDRRRSLFAIEIKDYPDHPLAAVPSADQLAEMCDEKVRDSLAQLIHSAPLVGRPEPGTDEIARAFGATEHALHIVVWVEDAQTPPLDVVELQVALERRLAWLPTSSVTVFSVETTPWPPGLTVTRI